MSKKPSPLHSIIVFVLIPLLALLGIGTLLLIFTSPPDYADIFTNLEEIQAYARTTNELTPMAGINTLKPDFSPYYATLKPTTSRRIKEKILWLLYRIGLAQRPCWSITGFKHTLERLGKRNEAKDFKGNCIAKISSEKDDRFFVFGTLQGAFHSLVRDLKHLNDRGIIDPALKIKNPNHYIVFMGEAISRSAFTLETLSLIMKVLEANPANTIYLRGGHESKNYWQEHTMKTELMIRARHISSSKVPLENEVNRFFNTLPLAFYIGMHPTPSKDFIRISKRGIGSNPLLDEKNYAPFLATIHSTITPYAVVRNADPSDTPVTIHAILKSEKKRYAYQSMPGLRMLANDTGTTAWTLLSCPTVVYEQAKAIRFFYDAFTEVIPGEKLSEWTITLHHRDRRTKNPFTTKTFNLLSGLEQSASSPTKTAPTAKIQPTEQKPQSLTDTTAPLSKNIVIENNSQASHVVNIDVDGKPTTITITVTAHPRTSEPQQPKGSS